MPLSNCDLFNKVKESKFNYGPSILTFVLENQNLSLNNLNENQYDTLEHFIKNFLKQSKRKWLSANYTQINFERRCKD